MHRAHTPVLSGQASRMRPYSWPVIPSGGPKIPRLGRT
jgi:hypothetical protein